MWKPDIWKFKKPAAAAWQYVQQNALTLSGRSGLIAGGFVLLAGGYDSAGLIFAGVLEWSSFGTNWRWGKNDVEQEGDAKVEFSLSKGLQPWRYPNEFFILQQGICGLGYLSAGLNWKAVALSIGKLTSAFQNHNPGQGDHASLVKASALVIQGVLCVAAPFVQCGFKEREGWRHPRSLSSACLVASSFACAVGAYQTGSTLLGIASFFFVISTSLPGISRRQSAVPTASPPPTPG